MQRIRNIDATQQSHISTYLVEEGCHFILGANFVNLVIVTNLTGKNNIAIIKLLLNDV